MTCPRSHSWTEIEMDFQPLCFSAFQSTKEFPEGKISLQARSSRVHPEAASFVPVFLPGMVCVHRSTCGYIFLPFSIFFHTQVYVLKRYPALSLLMLSDIPLRSFLMGTWILTIYTPADYSTERINQAVFFSFFYWGKIDVV